MRRNTLNHAGACLRAAAARGLESLGFESRGFESRGLLSRGLLSLARSAALLLACAVSSVALTGCASTPSEDVAPTPEVAPPVSGSALGRSLGLRTKRAPDGSVVYLESTGEDRIALFPNTHTSTVRGVRFKTQERLATSGGDVLVSARDAEVLRRMWQQGVHVGPSRSTAGSFHVSPSDVGSPHLTLADLDPMPVRARPRASAHAESSGVGAASAAERRKWGVTLRRPWQYIVVHHSATPGGNAAAFHRAHLARGWDGLGYHFVIGNGNKSPDGRIEVGFRWERQREGAHAGNDLMNQRGIGICLVGDFNKTAPTPAQMRSLRRLCDFLTDYCEIAPQNLRLHRDFRQTACPGRYFPRNFALRPIADIRAAAHTGHGHDPATMPR